MSRVINLAPIPISRSRTTLALLAFVSVSVGAACARVHPALREPVVEEYNDPDEPRPRRLLEVGETLHVAVPLPSGQTFDRLVWALGPQLRARDTVAIVRDSLGRAVITEVVPPEWKGRSGRLIAWGLDSSGVMIGIDDLPSTEYWFFPRTDPLPGAVARFTYADPQLDAGAITYDSRRDRLYVTHTAAAQISVTDLGTMRPLRAISVPASPTGIDLSLSGDSLLVIHAFSGDVTVIDLVSNQALAPLHLAALDSVGGTLAAGHIIPSSIQVAANGKAMIQLLHPTSSGASTVEVDLGTKTHRLRHDAHRSPDPHMEWWRRVQATPDRERILVLSSDCAQWYIAREDRFSACGDYPVANYFWQVSFDAKGSRASAGTVVLDRRLSLLARSPVTISAMHPDGAHIVALIEDSLVKIRLSTGRYVSRVKLRMGPHRLLLLPGGRQLIALNGQQVTKVDLGVF